jgi:hypothetical protein
MNDKRKKDINRINDMSKKRNEKLIKKVEELVKLIFELDKRTKIVTISALGNHKSFGEKKIIKRINGLFYERKDFKIKLNIKKQKKTLKEKKK